MVANYALMASRIMSLFYRATDFYLHQISVIEWYDRGAKIRFQRTFHLVMLVEYKNFGSFAFNINVLSVFVPLVRIRGSGSANRPVLENVLQ